MNNQVQLFDSGKVEIIKNMYFKGLTHDDLEIFLHACKRTQLDPFMRQIYAVKRKNYKTNQEEMTIQTGIDGYRLIAERTGRYAPGREPTYTYTVEGRILSSTAYVKKMTDDGTWHEVAATAYFDEYCQKTKEYQGKPSQPTQFWLKMGHLMLGKCAEALALRKAFPADLSGIYTKEEMDQADLEDPSAETSVAQQENEKLKLELEKEKKVSEEEEGKMIIDFIAQYPDEKDEQIEMFFAQLKKAWTHRSYSYIIDKYRDHDLFMNDFGKWKAKQEKK